MDKIYKFFSSIPTETIKDIFYFILFVTPGAIVKMIKEKSATGKKPSLKWFLAEALMSFFVAAIIYAVFDQFLQLNKLFTYAMCALGGSFSTVFHSKVEELIGVFFDALKTKTKNLFNIK